MTECDQQTEVATGTGGAGWTELHQQNRDILQWLNVTSKQLWPKVLEVLAELDCNNRIETFYSDWMWPANWGGHRYWKHWQDWTEPTEEDIFQCLKVTSWQLQVATGTCGAGRTELHQQRKTFYGAWKWPVDSYRQPQVLVVLAGLNYTNRMENFTVTESDQQSYRWPLVLVVLAGLNYTNRGRHQLYRLWHQLYRLWHQIYQLWSKKNGSAQSHAFHNF